MPNSNHEQYHQHHMHKMLPVKGQVNNSVYQKQLNKERHKINK